MLHQRVHKLTYPVAFFRYVQASCEDIGSVWRFNYFISKLKEEPLNESGLYSTGNNIMVMVMVDL